MSPLGLGSVNPQPLIITLAGRNMSKIVNIDGLEYIEQPENELPFGNVCRHCDFYRTSCYNRDDFDCHSDSRPDGIGVIFVRFLTVSNDFRR